METASSACVLSANCHTGGDFCMKFKFLHNNINVLDLERSLEFYQTALDL